jgi:hypothetical protein
MVVNCRAERGSALHPSIPGGRHLLQSGRQIQEATAPPPPSPAPAPPPPSPAPVPPPNAPPPPVQGTETEATIPNTPTVCTTYTLCFPGSATVQTPGEKKALNEVQVGDKVSCRPLGGRRAEA